MDVYHIHGSRLFYCCVRCRSRIGRRHRTDRFMATVFPPVALIPVHGVVQAGSNVTRTIIAHKLVMKQAILPFAIGALIGSAIGGKIVVSIPVALLQAILGVFMLYVCFAPKITAGVPTGKRFFILGSIGAFISMFIGATGTILAPWVRGVSDDRRVFVAHSQPS